MENGFLINIINVMNWISDYYYFTTFVNYYILTTISFNNLTNLFKRIDYFQSNENSFKKKKRLIFHFKEVTHKLPSYLTNYDDYYKMLINYKISAGFIEFKLFNFNKKDCDQLNISILIDTA